MKNQFNLFSILPVLFVAAMILFEKKKQKKIDDKYDEMQLRIRGKSAWYGFYASAFYMAVLIFAEKSFGFYFLTGANAVFLGVMLGGSVMIGYSILHDSYYGMDRSRSYNTMFLFMIGVMEVVAVLNLVRLIENGAFRDLTIPCNDDRLMVVECIPVFTSILLTTLMKHLRKEEAEE